MGWPSLIELHDSQYSHSYDGSELVETWYVEPYSASTAFIASMLGRVDMDAGIQHADPDIIGGGGGGFIPDRTPPARHFLYNWCYAMQCDIVPFDPRQFSYLGSTELDPTWVQNLKSNIGTVKDAVEEYKLKSDDQLNSEANIYDLGLADTDYTAGAFITVTYRPVINIPVNTPFGDTNIITTNWDMINWKFTPQIRTNTINKGLGIVCPQGIAGALGVAFLGPIGDLLTTILPDAGIAPVQKEEYMEMTFERRMLPPSFDIGRLGRYIGLTNGEGGAQNLTLVATDAGFISFYQGTLKFTSFEPNWIQVPKVDVDGNPKGYNNWLNLKIHIDWRTIGTAPAGIDGNGHPVGLVDDFGNPANNVAVFDINGVPTPGLPITWNHVLVYPGFMHIPDGLGWYRCQYGVPMKLPAILGINVAPLNAQLLSDPFPMTNNFNILWKGYF